ncbi:MAG: 50S ribosomal protein L35 [Candidatus Paceibacterota bacterium]
MSSEKTNKSFTKRLKKTRTGKVKSRKPGKNHFNAKESRSKTRAKNRMNDVNISKKTLDGVMPHS